MESPYPVVAAIDFGTHGTGYAWIEVIAGNREASQRQPYSRSHWPGTSASGYPKTLTALLLDASDQVVARGYEALNEWNDRSARRTHQGYTYVSNFKMALKPDAYQGMVPPGRGARTIDRPEKAYPLVRDYLRWMYGMALADIQKSGYLEDQIRWCVTVPAIWDDEQQQQMREAAVAAGMPDDPDRLLLAIEPEAAALHCQIHLARPLGSQDEYFDMSRDGRRFTVVDCGGGTVDITSYRVEHSTDGRPRLAQVAPPTGAKLGSEYINEAYEEEILGRWFGAEVLARVREKCPHALGEMLDNWESHKVNAAARLGPDGDPVLARGFHPGIPGEIIAELDEAAKQRLAAAGSPHRIAVEPEEIRALFDHVVLGIVENVQDHLREVCRRDGDPTEPERLLLVGGLCGSEYLRLRLQQAFGDKASLIAPTEPVGAVLYGAVHFGYEPSMIRSRLARYTYGTEIRGAFRPGVDPEDKKIETDGVEYCERRFSVFVAEGAAVEYDEVVTQDFFPSTEDPELVLQFYRTRDRAPEYVDGSGCEPLKRILVELDPETMKRPRLERIIRVHFRFGRAQVDVRAVNVTTGQEMQCALQFHATY